MKFLVDLFSKVTGKSTHTQIRNLISKCRSLGLPEKDCLDADSYLEYNELGLAFETILEQMYQYNILIDLELYHQIKAIAGKMSMTSKEYEFMSKLIRPIS